MSLLKEISITDLSNLRIGHASDYKPRPGGNPFFTSHWVQKLAVISAVAVLLPGKLLSPLLSLPTIPSMLLSCPEVLPMDWLLLTV